MKDKDNVEMFGVGLMSGTSLDGLDLVFCSFRKIKNSFEYECLASQTVPHSKWWKRRLSQAMNASGAEIAALNVDFGLHSGNLVQGFLNEKKLPKPDFIASHGHTVFHQPSAHYTLQIGSGAHIYAQTGIPTVCDFRSLDVALGGQGAPLVPVGDALLFGEFATCINLGGFANGSYQKDNKRFAHDICPVNVVINPLAEQLGLPYDDRGEIAKKGSPSAAILDQLNALSFYQKEGPKSLGMEWVNAEIHPLLEASSLTIEDQIATITHHAAQQIASALRPGENLFTGGGTHNHFLLHLIEHYASDQIKIVVPKGQLIDFKEAIVFGFLGFLRLLEIDNVWAEVTGAKSNSCSGAIYG